MTEGLLKTAEKYVLGSESAPVDVSDEPQASDKMERSDEVPLRIIGVDPGLASTGWGVVELLDGKPKHIAHGCIETSTEKPSSERLAHIYRSFLKPLRKYKPVEAAMENLYFGKNISSAMAVAEARGVLLMALGYKGIPVRELTPNTIKKAVTGVTKADKNQIQEMVRVILDLPEIPKPDHAADALGAAIFAANNLHDISGV